MATAPAALDLSLSEERLVLAYADALAALASTDGQHALACVGRAEAAVADLQDPDPIDVFNVRLLRIRVLRQAGRNEETAQAAQALGGQLEVADDCAQVWRLRVQVALEWGDALRSAGRYGDADPHLRGALVVAVRELGADDPDTGSAWNSIGVWHRYHGEYDEAFADYEQALRIAEWCGGPDCVDVASILHNVASLHQTRGDAERAEQPARRAVRIRQAALGRWHPDVAADLGVLGVILADLGRLDEAADCYRRARNVFSDAARQVELAYLACNEAALEHLRGRLDAADVAYRAAQQMCESTVGEHHPQVAVVLLNRATLALLRGDNDAARQRAAECEAILAGVVDDQHPHLAGARMVRADAALAAWS